MKSNKDYILRKIAGEAIMIPTGKAAERLNGTIQLTETAAFVWEHVDTAKDMDDIARQLTEEYDVSMEQALYDVKSFLFSLYIRDMVYDIPEFEGVNKEEAVKQQLEDYLRFMEALQQQQKSQE